MDPIIVALLAFLGVAGVIGALAYFMRTTDGSRAVRLASVSAEMPTPGRMAPPR